MKKGFVSLLLTCGLFAAGITLPEHFTAQFSQTVTNPQKKVIHYSGKVLFSDKSHLKWIYQEPTRKEVCTDGKEVLVVDHDLEQTSAYRIEKGFDLAHIIAQAKPYKPSIYVTEYAGRQYTLKVDAKGRLQSVAYYDDLDNKVQILFTHIQYGKGSLPTAKMRCDYPADYDMIRG
jgi:outer membrane lipoprotein carrier protein